MSPIIIYSALPQRSRIIFWSFLQSDHRFTLDQLDPNTQNPDVLLAVRILYDAASSTVLGPGLRGYYMLASHNQGPAGFRSYLAVFVSSLFVMVTSVEMGLANAQVDQSFRGLSADTYNYYRQGQYEVCYYTQCPPNSNGEMQLFHLISVS